MMADRNTNIETQSHLSRGKNWLQESVEFFGFPAPWSRSARLMYTDPHQSDLTLTTSGDDRAQLKVQAVEGLKEDKNCTWQRHYINDVSTVTVQISKLPQKAQIWFQTKYQSKEWAPSVSWVWYGVMWIFAFATLWVWFVWLIIRHGLRMVFSSPPLTPELSYVTFDYEDNKYARIAANPTDNRKIDRRRHYDRPSDKDQSGTYGVIRPRVLLQTQGDKAPKRVLKPDFPTSLEYVFIAFNFKHFPLNNVQRLTELVRVANKATQQLGFNYFWVASSCMGIAPGENVTLLEQKRIEESDIYSISDVIRGAARVIVVLPDPTETPCPRLKELVVDSSATKLEEDKTETFVHLTEWGARVWTFPEVLLGPNEPIRICWKITSTIRWSEIKKDDFPAKVWEDPDSSMQMVRHYNNTNLTRLEFIKIALDCLMKRQQKGLQWHYPGDLSYVLMGFLRIRPPINKYDSSIQAFARLSLPADNDRLIERFVCLQPPDRMSHWGDMIDDYKADLWSIEPSIQLAGVGENDTLIIERALGAKIELEHFKDVSAVRLSRFRRLEGVIAGLMPGATESMARHFRKTKYREVYPRLFSFEGFMSIVDIEEKLFGGPAGLLSWSQNGSTLSRHEPGVAVYEPRLKLAGDEKKVFAGLQAFGRETSMGHVDVEAQNGVVPQQEVSIIPNRDSIELEDGRIMTYPIIGRQPWMECKCVARASPTNNCICSYLTERQLEQMGRSSMGEEKIFTLIDTTTMTVTLLKAAWPPQALIACGTEGGMERVLACSYDCTSGVFYRESVLRFPGKVLDHMHRLPKLRLGLRRHIDEADIRSST